MNILVVDNDRAFVRSLEIILGEDGHEVLSFYDPTLASAYINQRPNLDVLLVDYMMAQLTGEELLMFIHHETPSHCRTFVITGHCEAIASFLVLRNFGVQAILPKPLDVDQLCELVSHSS